MAATQARVNRGEVDALNPPGAYFKATNKNPHNEKLRAFCEQAVKNQTAADVALRRLIVAVYKWTIFSPLLGSLAYACYLLYTGADLLSPHFLAAAFIPTAFVVWFLLHIRILDQILNPFPWTAARRPVQRRKVAVIGGGPSGLVALKESVEAGHDATCFELLPEIGGMWVQDGKDERISDFTRMVSSPAVTCFGDFSPDPWLDRQWTRDEYLFYLRDYATAFGLRENIKFNHKVLKVKSLKRDATDAYLGQYKWQVTVQHVETGATTSAVYDAVIISSGLQERPFIPTIPGMDEFKGEIKHTVELTKESMMKDKEVLVVGLGESGSDVAGRAGAVGKKATLSIRHGYVVIPRIRKGVPGDYAGTRFRASSPLPVHSYVMMMNLKLRRWAGYMDYKQAVRSYLMEQLPFFKLPCQPATKSETFIQAVEDGTLAVKPAVSRLSKDKVYFEDGSSINAPDLIVFATGYQMFQEFLELPEGVKKVHPGLLYRNLIYPEIGASLALVGYARPVLLGGIPPMAEMASRWLAQVYSSQIKPLSRARMEAATKKQVEQTNRDLVGSKDRPSPLVYFSVWMDPMAREVGCMPRLFPLLFQPRLLYKLFWGPVMMPHYRLYGPGACFEKAKEHIVRTNGLMKPDTGMIFLVLHFYTWPLALLGFKSLQSRTSFL